MGLEFLADPTDLSALTYTKPDALRAYAKAINNLPLKEIETKKLVLAIGTGGTISMKIENGKWSPDLDFDNIMERASFQLKESFLVKGFDAFCIDSSQMNYGHICDLMIIMSYLWKTVELPFAGFLVLHGTDTMTYSAAAVSIMMGQGLPFSVVYTGAQKPIQEPINDAISNLNNALYLLESLYDNNMAEVVVCMGDRAVLGTSSEKIDDSQVNAFDAPLHKHVARFNRLDYPVQIAPWLKEKRNIDFTPQIWDKGWSHTLLVKSHLGLMPDMVERQVGDPQIKAVLLYSYGGSTVYEPIIDTIMPVARERNLCVFVVSPVNTNPKMHYESSHYMMEQGVVPLYMTLPAALAKIETALRLYPDHPEKIARFMIENYVGEVPTEESRFQAVL